MELLGEDWPIGISHVLSKAQVVYVEVGNLDGSIRMCQSQYLCGRSHLGSLLVDGSQGWYHQMMDYECLGRRVPVTHPTLRPGDCHRRPCRRLGLGRKDEVE